MVDERYREFEEYRIQNAIVDLWRQGKTGILKAKLGANKHALYFKDGIVVGGLTAEPRFKLPQILIRRGYLTHAQYSSVKPNFKSQLSVGANLLEMGLISQQELERGARQQVYAIFSGFMRSSAGVYYFRECLLPEDLDHRPLDFPRDIFHALMAMKDKAWIIGRFNDDLDFVCERIGEPPLDMAKLGLGQFADRAYLMIDGKNDYKRIAFEADTDDFLLLKFLYTLRLLNHIRIVDPNVSCAAPIESASVPVAEAMPDGNGLGIEIDHAVEALSDSEQDEALAFFLSEEEGEADAPLPSTAQAEAASEDFDPEPVAPEAPAAADPFGFDALQPSPADLPDAEAAFASLSEPEETPTRPFPVMSAEATQRTERLPDFARVMALPEAEPPPAADTVPPPRRRPRTRETPKPKAPPKPVRKYARIEVVVVALLMAVCVFLAMFFFMRADYTPPVLDGSLSHSRRLAQTARPEPRSGGLKGEAAMVAEANPEGTALEQALGDGAPPPSDPLAESLPPQANPAVAAQDRSTKEVLQVSGDGGAEQDAGPDDRAAQPAMSHSGETPVVALGSDKSKGKRAEPEQTASRPIKTAGEPEPQRAEPDRTASRPKKTTGEPEAQRAEPDRTASPPNAGGDPAALLAQGDYAAAAQLWRSQATADGDAWTVTIFLLCDPESLPKVTAEAGGDPAYFIIPRQVSGKTCYLACWGRYESRLKALRQTKNLPTAWDRKEVEVKRLADLF